LQEIFVLSLFYFGTGRSLPFVSHGRRGPLPIQSFRFPDWIFPSPFSDPAIYPAGSPDNDSINVRYFIAKWLTLRQWGAWPEWSIFFRV
jgi:hypothetical protein